MILWLSKMCMCFSKHVLSRYLALNEVAALAVAVARCVAKGSLLFSVCWCCDPAVATAGKSESTLGHIWIKQILLWLWLLAMAVGYGCKSQWQRCSLGLFSNQPKPLLRGQALGWLVTLELVWYLVFSVQGVGLNLHSRCPCGWSS